MSAEILCKDRCGIIKSRHTDQGDMYAGLTAATLGAEIRALALAMVTMSGTTPWFWKPQ